MATAKYNWEEIKQRYLEAPEIEVEHFLRKFLELDPKKPLSGDKKTKTTGWRTEKEVILKVQTEKAKVDLENDPDVKIANENILLAIKEVENKVANLIGGKTEYTIDDLPKIKIGWEILRVSANLPTTFSKNENNNKNTIINVTTNLLDE